MDKRLTRALCILLALVLMSSSAVSYTYAEYAKGASSADNARTTLWGVTVAVTGNAFATKYVTDTTYNGIDVSVKSSTHGQANAVNVVAPGTTGKFTGVRCTGTPETSVAITVTPNLQLTNWTDSSSNYYCPLRITVNGTEYYGLNYSTSAEFETAVENAMKAANKTYAPGTDLSKVPGLNGDYSWTWEFNDANGTKVTRTNAKDTAVANKGTVVLSVGCEVLQVD